MRFFIPLLALAATLFNSIQATNNSAAPIEPRDEPKVVDNRHYIHPSCTQLDGFSPHFLLAGQILRQIRQHLLTVWAEDTSIWVTEDWNLIPEPIQRAIGRFFFIKTPEEWALQSAGITGMYNALAGSQH
jgi:hypothetical protein